MHQNQRVVWNQIKTKKKTQSDMCGIFAAFNIRGTYDEARALAYKLSRRQRHRGPDRSGLLIYEASPGLFHILVHERLNIVDLSEHGKQPFVLLDDPNIQFLANGEIYNYESHRAVLEKKYRFQGHSDCEIIGMLYKEFGVEKCWEQLEGMFGIIILDKSTNQFFVGRDHVGMIPVYIGHGKNGEFFAASEMKTFHDQVDDIQQLLPGHFVVNGGQMQKWYNPSYYNMDLIPTKEVNYQELRDLLINVVKHEVGLCSAPFGLFLSGGVDSSLIAGIVARLVRNGEIDIKKKGMRKLHSFTIGLKGSPDLFYAQQVANFLGTEHHAFTYTVDEGIDQIPEVIYHTETFNNTTIRASTPMYQMCRRIKALGIKMCVTGEGSDEIFGGYLYFHKAPNGEEFHRELIRKVQDLYKYDLLRANKACLAWGIEVRPPFMNEKLMQYVMSIDPKYKMPKNFNPAIEKYILRKAFDCPEDPFCPSEILWRQKEQFSDGVGYSWRDGIREKCDRIISDEQFSKREEVFPVNPPMDKEQYWYRQIFEENFPSKASVLTVPYCKSIACSTEKALEWDESFKKNADESGRMVLAVHQQPIQFQTEKCEEDIENQDHFML